jgi:hypothetical protein
MIQSRGARIFQKSRSHLKIFVVKGMTRSKFHTEGPKILGAAVQNMEARFLAGENQKETCIC